MQYTIAIPSYVFHEKITPIIHSPKESLRSSEEKSYRVKLTKNREKELAWCSVYNHNVNRLSFPTEG